MSRVDLLIIAGNDTENPISVSSRHLTDLSPKWDQLLTSVEKDGNGCRIINIPQISQHVMENVIKYINVTFMDPNPQLISICDENVQEYFSAGQFLEMEEIKTFCLEYLKSRKWTLENASFLFKLIGVFDNNLVTCKIREFFMQNSQQLDVVVKKCKSEGISESTLAIALVDWFSSRDNLKGISFNLKNLVQEFSNMDKKLKIVRTFFQMGDSQAKNQVLNLLLDIVKNSSNCNHSVQKSCASTQTENENQDLSVAIDIDDDESFSLENFKVDLDNLDNLPNSLKFQMNELEKNEEFPSFTFVNYCFFESEELRQEFDFITPLPTCIQNQNKNWLCDPHPKCTNKFNLMEIDQPAIFIKKSPISGIGLFSEGRLVEGQVICPYAGKITKNCEDKVYPMNIWDGKNKKYTIDASEYGNLSRFANGELNATPNVVYDSVLGSSTVMAVLTVVKAIAPGEEIIAKYGKKYWEAHKKELKVEHLPGSFTSTVQQSGSSYSYSPSSSSPINFPVETETSCKRRRIEGSATNNKREPDSNDEELEISSRNETLEMDFNASSYSSSSPPSLSSLLSPTSQSGSEQTDLTNEISAPQGIIYFLLGTRETPQGGLGFWSFDIKRKACQLEGNLPRAFKDRRRLAMLHHKGDIYFMGGESCQTEELTNQVQIYNLESQKWRLMKMVEGRFDFKAVILNNCIYAVGGCVEDPRGPEYVEVGANDVEKLSLDSPFSKWEIADDYLLSCRSDCGLVVLNGKIYAIGGSVQERKRWEMTASKLCECFDPTIPISEDQNQWNAIAPMKYKRLGLSAVATSDRIFALGGAKSFDESDKGMRTVEVYDPDTNSWTRGPSMKHPRKFFSAVFFENCIYAIGGDDTNEPTMEKFDLETQKWTVECKVKADGNFLTVAFS